MHSDTQALLSALADASGRPRQAVKSEFQSIVQELNGVIHNCANS